MFSNLGKREISCICLPHNLIVLLTRKQLNVNITYDSGGEGKIKIRKSTLVNAKNINLVFCFVHIMSGLDQCHLYPKLEVPRQTCPGQESKPGLFGGR